MRSLTANQLELLMHVGAGGPDGPLDFDQLLALLSWKPTKESAQFPIRSLVKRGLLEKGELSYRRGRRRVMYHLTAEGRLVLDPRPGVAAVVPELRASSAASPSTPAPAGKSERVLSKVEPIAVPGLSDDLSELELEEGSDPGQVEILEG